MEREWVHRLISNFSVATINELNTSKLLDEKLLHTPPCLYKIRNCDHYALDNLRNKTLHLRVANDFNDPYDTAFWADYKLLALEDKLKKIGIQPEKIETVLSSPDPVETALMLASKVQSLQLSEKEWRHALTSGNSNFYTEQLEWLINQLKETYKICSLSERIDSVLMWSHYGKNHTGFAMEYDFSKLHRNHFATLSLWPVAYTETLFDITHIMQAQRKSEPFNSLFGVPASLCKAKDWQYEREWRLVIPDGIGERGINMDAPLKAVHLGARISKQNEIEIRDICESLEVSVSKVRLAPHEYRMVSESLD